MFNGLSITFNPVIAGLLIASIKSRLLQEDGFYLLLEDGDYILLEYV